MSRSTLREIIDQYECVLNDVAHRFAVQWAAPEPRCAQYTVAVEVRPENGQPKTVHLMVPRSTPRNALLKLLVDAVETSS